MLREILCRLRRVRRASGGGQWLHTRLQRLGTDYVDLYQPARLDPAVPIEDTVGALADPRAGRGTCVTSALKWAATIRRAHAVHPWPCSLSTRSSARQLEADILPAVRALGIGITAYGVLSRAPERHAP